MFTACEKTSFPTRAKSQRSAWCIGSTRKMLVVNTNERLSECDETPCSLYCKLTLGEDSPGSLAQGKPRDKVNPIHHSPTPAQELLVAMDPHPPSNSHIHQVPSRVYLQCQGSSRFGQSLYLGTDLEFTSARAGRRLEVWDVLVSLFPTVIRRVFLMRYL